MQDYGSRCAHFRSGYCRSCTLLDRSREAELEGKESLVRENIAAKLSSRPRIFPIFSPESATASRSKAKLAVSGTLERPIVGLLRYDGRTLDARELLDCPLHLPEINLLATTLAKEVITDFQIPPYDPVSRCGELKSVIVTANGQGDEMILRFVCRSRDTEPQLRKAAQMLRDRFPFVRVVSLNVQPIPHAILEGAEEHLLTADGSIREQYTDFSVRLGPQSFKQVTHETADALYRRARERAATLIQPERSLDLYCGAGAFSMAVAPVSGNVLGVDISEDAVNSAALAASDSGVSNVRFESANLEEDAARFLDGNPSLVILNPPRRGLGSALVQELCRRSPFAVLYSSCNPATLTRDLQLLESTFSVTELHPFDMFPQTPHLEVLAVLTRNASV